MRYVLLIYLFLFFGCSDTQTRRHTGLEYYPNAKDLVQGLVFKYYQHQSKKGGQPKTDIVYRKMILKDSILEMEEYNAAFQKVYAHLIAIRSKQWIMLKEEAYAYQGNLNELFDTYTYEIMDSVYQDWSKNEARLAKRWLKEESGSKLVFEQTGLKDSLDQDKMVKYINGELEIYAVQKGEESLVTSYQTMKRFEEGLGMTQSLMENDEYIYEMELDEIMTLSEFERRANHGTHRVGYIDTLKILDDHTLFRPCYLPQKINDYYNDQRAGFVGGKGRLRAILKQKLDLEKLKEESGYLTFRFVVNCDGEVGWFVTEEADLDYQKKRFSEESKMHLYHILKAEKKWKNLTINGEPRDAYTYVTFKLKDGEIIEILP